MLKSMSLALPLYSLCSVAGDEKLVFRRSVSGERQWKGKLLPAGLHGKGLSQRGGCLLKRLCCAVQPLQEVQYNSRKGAPGLEGATPQSNGVLGSTEWRALPDIWRTAAEKFGDRVALIDPHHHPFTTMSFSQLRQAILEFAEGLRVTGILPNEKISLFADNSCRWLVADQGIMAAGAIDAVRGTRSSIKELIHIYTHSDSVALVVDNCDLLGKLGPELQDSTSLKFVVLLWGEKPQPTEGPEGFKFVVYTYDEVLAKGRDRLNFLASMGHPVSTRCDYIEPEDIATLVYTSGTTGNPKGVMLTHANLLHQVLHLGKVVDINPGDRFVSLLPPWHMYERSCEYFSLAQGIEQIYTNVKSLKEDLKKYSPDYLVSVPLVFDILYRKIEMGL